MPLTFTPGEVVYTPVSVPTDHGVLSGLADDDHTQYHTDARAQTWLDGILVSTADAEAGTSTTVESWSAERVKEAIIALAPSGGASIPFGSLQDVTLTSPTTGQFVQFNGSIWVNVDVNIDGDVEGPGSATDNAIARYDLATGKLIQNSTVTIADDGAMGVPAEIEITIGANSGLDVYRLNAIEGATGLISGGAITRTGSTYEIEDGTGIIIDSFTDASNPTYKEVSWSGLTGLTPTTPANIITRVYIDSDGNLQEQLSAFTAENRRDVVTIGSVITNDGVNISSVGQTAEITNGPIHTLYDFLECIGGINNSGNHYSSASTLLTIAKTAGSTCLRGANLANNDKDPNVLASPAESPIASFNHLYHDGSGGFTIIPLQTVIDPDQYDDLSGTLAAVPNNRWTNQRIHFFPAFENFTAVQFGQVIYTSLAAAQAGASTEVFEPLPNITLSAIRTTLSVKSGTTDLSSATDAAFTNTGLFGVIYIQ